MERGPHGTGLTRRQLTREKDDARAEMEQEQSIPSVIVLESEDGSKGTLHQN